MMPCEIVKLPNGPTAIACSRGNRRKKCACGKPASKLCDFILERRHAGNHKTCDKPLCVSCAVNVGPDRDYCPGHPIPDGVGVQMPLEGV